MSDYQPGHCNIGHRQRLRRAAVAVVAFVAAAGYVVAYSLGFVPRALLVGVFVPLAIGFEWGLQASRAFCVRLALLGQYTFEAGGSGTVDDPAHRRTDRVGAAKITVVGVALAALTTAVLAVVF